MSIVKAVKVETPTPHEKYVRAIYDFLSRNIRYLRDANLVDTLQTPDITLQFMSGDCDDMATLSASLLESVGYRTRFKITGYGGATYSHVYIMVDLPDARSIPFDITIRKFGAERKGIRNMMIEGRTGKF